MTWNRCALTALLLAAATPALAQTTTILYSNDFDGRQVAWQTTGLWGTDSTPDRAPGGASYSGTHSLNFNNGTNYSGLSEGTATSPGLQATPGAELTVAFRCNYQTETTGLQWDKRAVIVKIDGLGRVLALAGGRRLPSARRCAAMGTWHLHEISVPVPARARGNVRIEFVFDSVDDYANDFAGWFIDDVLVSETVTAPPSTFNQVTLTTQNFRQYNVAVVIQPDRSVEVRQSSPTARYALITGQATSAELDALTTAIQNGRLASIPPTIPDPNTYIVAPTWFRLEVDAPVSTAHSTIGGSLGVYGQWAAQLAPVIDALVAIQRRLVAGPAPTGDDHGDTAQTATTVSLDPNAPATAGEINPAGDVDFFNVTDTSPVIMIFPPPQRTYVIETTVVGNMDTVLELYDANGTLVASNDDSGGSLASRVAYTTSHGTPLFAKVRHYSASGTGSYTIRAGTNSTTQPPQPSTDDHGNGPATATTLEVGAPAMAGTIGTAGDVDFFQLQQIVIAIFPPPTFTYVIETTVVGSMDTVIEVYAADGVTLLASNDDAPGMGYASKVTYTAQAGTVRFVKVRHYSSNGTGDYTLRISTQ